MTVEELTAMYPNRPFALFHVERGSGDDRKLIWMAQWYAGYFTSDTDRHVYHEGGMKDIIYGDSPGAALQKLAECDLEKAHRHVASYERLLAEAREELAVAGRVLAREEPPKAAKEQR